MLYVLSAFFSLFLIFLGRERITDIVDSPGTEKIQASVLLTELRQLPLPDGHVWLNRPQTFDKGTITGATAHLQGTSSPEDVLAYYARILPTMGWSLANTEQGANGGEIKFCKKGMSLIVEASPEGVGTEYYVGVVWTKFRKSQAYCASKGPVRR